MFILDSCTRRVHDYRSREARNMRVRRRNEPRSLPRRSRHRRHSISNAPPPPPPPPPPLRPPPLSWGRGWFSKGCGTEKVQAGEGEWEKMGEAETKKMGEKSALLLLPAEIREAIFLEVLGGKLIHLVQLRRRLGHFCCYPETAAAATAADDQRYHRERSCIGWDHRKTYRVGEALVERRLERSSDGGLGLLRSCRQVYRECITLLYDSSTFDVNHPQTLIFLARTLLPRRLAAIRSLQVNFPGTGLHRGYSSIRRPTVKAPDDLKTWVDMCAIITLHMTGLKSLTLSFERAHPYLPPLYLEEVRRESIEDLLQYLACLRGLTHFDMWVSPAFWKVEDLVEEWRRKFTSKKPIEEDKPPLLDRGNPFLTAFKRFL